MVLTGAGSAATPPDLSTPAAIDAYLTSIGVSPASVVKQEGKFNYAGPTCPGGTWNCTTSNMVVQIGSAGGSNVAECSGGSCVLLQVGPNNKARCVQHGTGATEVQACTIVQNGARNDSVARQTIDQDGGSTQAATQTAKVDQSSAGALNSSGVEQSVKQTVVTGDVQTQDAHQSAEVDQSATGSARNRSWVVQTEHGGAFGGTTQMQNASSSALADCSPATFPFEPNECANVDQSSDAGTNESSLRQRITENGETGAVATQQQGSFPGGIEGKVHQDTVSGSSSNEANQTKHQTLRGAAGSSQTQFDPLFCCGLASQFGGGGNSETIDQTSTQGASEDDAFQQLAILAESASPSGSCGVTQHVTNNSDSAENGASASPCPFMQVFTICESANEEEEEGGGCTPFTPVTTPPECVECDDLRLLAFRPNG